jgi:multidrug efflux pump
MAERKPSDSNDRIYREYPAGKALRAMVIPTIVSQIIAVAYNMADTFFVGLTNDKNAVAAVSLCLPVYTILTAISNLFGIGGASAISRALGEGNKPKAKQAFALAVWGSLILGLIYALIILVFRKPLLLLIGGDENDLDYSLTYLLWTVTIGGLPTILASVFGELVRSSGHPKTATVGLAIGACVNVGLDPLFMFVLLPKGQEVTGAAIATGISNLIGCLFFALYLWKQRKGGLSSFSIQEPSKPWSLALEILRSGLASFAMVACAMFSNCFLNAMLAPLGSAAMAGIGIDRKIDQLAYAVNQGIIQGMLPLVAYYYAAHQSDKMKKVILYSTIASEAFSLSCMLVSLLFPEALVGIFIRDQETIAYGAQFLRILCLAIPIYSLTFIIIAVLQAWGKGAVPFILSILHKGSIDIGFLFLFLSTLGREKILWAGPLCDAVALLVGILVMVAYLHKIKTNRLGSEASA